MTKVAILEGHGQRPDGTHDPGASGGGWNEQTATHHVARACSDDLRAAGVTVDPDESRMDPDPNYIGSTAAANRAGADYVVSFHFDWIKAPLGAFPLWVSGAGRQLGEAVVDATTDAGFRRRTYSGNPRTDLYLLRNTKAPATIIECSRIGEPALDTAAELSQFGRAAAAGILRHVGVAPPDPWVDVPVALITQDGRDKAAAIVLAHALGIAHLHRNPSSGKTIGRHRVHRAILVGRSARDGTLEGALRKWHGTRNVDRLDARPRHDLYGRMGAIAAGDRDLPSN